jgi:hypothetical protein
MMEIDDTFPAVVPAHRSVCSAVGDADGVIAKAEELGGKLAVGPVDVPIGRFAGIVDPQGAFFTIMHAR